MGQESIYILKRDGSQQPYDGEKIRSAVDKAFRAAGLIDEEGYALRIESLIQSELCHRNSQVAVEEIQDRVEAELMNLAPQVAKKYIIIVSGAPSSVRSARPSSALWMVSSPSRRMISIWAMRI